MSLGELAVLLPLVALCLWLTLFLFTLLDHFIYRGTYGHFLLGLDAIERQAGGSDAALAAVARHMREARTRYLARYLRNAASRPMPARIAADEYIARIGVGTLKARAAETRPRRRATQLVALYALSRTGDPAALPLLERALASERQVLAYAALDMLDIHGSEGAAEVLLRALESGVLPASRIATHLEHFRVDLTELYVARLQAGHPKSRYWIAYLLGKTPYGGRTGRILEELLSDPAPDVRKMALSTLAAIDAPELQAHAIRMLDDPVFFVRTQAARILARFPVAPVVNALARSLSDEHDAVQLAVKRSLVELGTVTLEHLPSACQAAGGRPDDTIAQITNSILHVQGDVDVASGPMSPAEVSHAR